MPLKTTRLPSDQFRARGYRTIATPFFLLKYKKNVFPHARIGVVVGMSVDKRATRRNFWKRQARSVLAGHALPGNDILMILSPGAGRLERKRFREEASKAMAKIMH